MYNVNEKRIEQVLSYMKVKLELIRPFLQMNEQDGITDPIQILAVERVVHIAIESIVDVGNHLIDGFIMRDPGGYIDIIEILRDEQVLPEDEAIVIKEFVSYRKTLVYDYTNHYPEEMLTLFKNSYESLMRFEDFVFNYIKKELI